MIKKIKKEKGSVTIEATIALSAFMFAIVTVLTIVNICIVQARISYAINTTAKELSQYSYLYSLTGLPDSEARLANAAQEGTASVDDILTNVNTVYNEIQNIGNTLESTDNDIENILEDAEEIIGNVDEIEAAGSSIGDTLGDIAANPKALMFGMAKMAGSDTLDLVKSRLIAAPLSKAMCKKHLVNEKDGDVDASLKDLGVVPNGHSYLGGLDFKQSSIFPNGSNRITVNVSYDVKVIPLLPIDFTFHFNQTAVTHGWLSGDSSFKSVPTPETASETNYIDNDTMWIKTPVKERVDFIRYMGIMELEDEGYSKTSGLSNVQLYNKDINEFAMISSMNPLWSSTEEVITAETMDVEAVKESVERLCGSMKKTTNGLSKITTKVEKDGIAEKIENDCTEASNKIVLVIPEDPGLKEKMEKIIEEADTMGVTIELVANHGTGTMKVEAN